jgi:hypothetical protein
LRQQKTLALFCKINKLRKNTFYETIKVTL